MKKLLNIALIGISCFTLVGCTNESKSDTVNIGEESKYVLRDDLVSMSVEEKSLTNSKATLILVNHTDETYIYGEPYSIQYEKDGIWYEIIPINDMNFNMIAYILKPKESKKITVDWEYHYGQLNPGKYRIVKDVFRELDKPIEPSDKVYIGAEFILISDEMKEILSSTKTVVVEGIENELIKTITDINEIEKIIDIISKATNVDGDVTYEGVRYNLEMYNANNQLIDVIEIFNENIGLKSNIKSRYKLNMEALMEIIKN